MSIQSVQFRNCEQVMNMGGPWIGDLYYGETLISKDAIVNNTVFDPNRQWLLFVKYYRPSNWARDVYFTINYFDLKSRCVFASEKDFQMVFIKQIENEKLEIYRAFHDALPRTKDYFNLYTETYHLAK